LAYDFGSILCSTPVYQDRVRKALQSPHHSLHKLLCASLEDPYRSRLFRRRLFYRFSYFLSPLFLFCLVRLGKGCNCEFSHDSFNLDFNLISNLRVWYKNHKPLHTCYSISLSSNALDCDIVESTSEDRSIFILLSIQFIPIKFNQLT
jgi:hypothetical protein